MRTLALTICDVQALASLGELQDFIASYEPLRQVLRAKVGKRFPTSLSVRHDHRGRNAI